MRRHMAKLNEAGQEELEEKLVLDGKLLPNRQGKRPGKIDPFAETVQRLIKKNPDFVKPSVPFDADTSDAAIEKYAKEKKPKQN